MRLVDILLNAGRDVNLVVSSAVAQTAPVELNLEVEGIIERRVGVKGMGFGADIQKGSRKRSIGEVLRQVQAEDLIQFGLISVFPIRYSLPIVGLVVGAGMA